MKMIPIEERKPVTPGYYFTFDNVNKKVLIDHWNVPDEDDQFFEPFFNHYGNWVTHWLQIDYPPAPE